MKPQDTTILGRLLTLMGVRHTAGYTDRRFHTMPFPTLFGLVALLREYGVEAHGYRIDNKDEIAQLPTPFIAPVNNRFVIVTSIGNKDKLCYCTAGVSEEIPVDEFIKAWSGVAFIAKAGPNAIEPDYGKHRLAEVMTTVRNIGLWVVAIALVAWGILTRGDLHTPSTIVMAAIDCFGLWLSFMLVGKDLGVKSRHSDAVCNVLEPGGCDRITKSDASTFLGVFHWSEVGFTYFSVGLAVVLFFPQMIGWLAVINVCALPYTVWSITYQKFKAKTWCTMCVGVQLSLWLQFIVALTAGWFHMIPPLSWNVVGLLLTYAFVMLSLNKLKSFIKTHHESD